MKLFISFVLCILLMLSSVLASSDLTDEQQKKIDALFLIVRCPVCDGQPLAGSEADLSKDLQKVIISMVKQNSSEENIKNYLRTIYGDDILFEPPVKRSTFILNYLPYCIIFLIGIGLFYHFQRAGGRVSTVFQKDDTAEDV